MQFQITNHQALFIQLLFSTVLSLQTSKQKLPLQNVYCIKNSPFTFPVTNGNEYFTESRLSPSNQYFFWNWHKRKRNKNSETKNIAHGNLNSVFFPKSDKKNTKPKYLVNLETSPDNENGNNQNVRHDKFSLTINNCDFKDADEYSLRVQNQAPEEVLARYRLTVVKKPEIPKIIENHSLPLTEIENSRHVQNELVLATCVTVSSPKARIEWYLEGEPNYPIESFKTKHSNKGLNKNEFLTTGFLMRNVNRNVSGNRYYCRARLEAPYNKISEISDRSYIIPKVHFRPDLPEISISNDRTVLTANSKAEPAATSNLWQIFIHVNSTKGIQSSRTDSGLVLVYNLESEGAVLTEHVRKELTENSPEALRHRTCVHQQRCRLVLGVSSKNSVGRSDTVMVDVFEFGFMPQFYDASFRNSLKEMVYTAKIQFVNAQKTVERWPKLVFWVVLSGAIIICVCSLILIAEYCCCRPSKKGERCCFCCCKCTRELNPEDEEYTAEFTQGHYPQYNPQSQYEYKLPTYRNSQHFQSARIIPETNLVTPPLENRFDTFQDSNLQEYNDNNNNSTITIVDLGMNNDPSPRIVTYTNEEYAQYNSLRDGNDSNGELYANPELYDNVDVNQLDTQQFRQHQQQVPFSRQYAPV